MPAYLAAGLSIIFLAACSSPRPERFKKSDILSSFQSATSVPKAQSQPSGDFDHSKPMSFESEITASAPSPSPPTQTSHLGLYAGLISIFLLLMLAIKHFSFSRRKKLLRVGENAEVMMVNGRFLEETDKEIRESILLSLGSLGIKNLDSLATVIRKPNGNLVILNRR